MWGYTRCDSLLVDRVARGNVVCDSLTSDLATRGDISGNQGGPLRDLHGLPGAGSPRSFLREPARGGASADCAKGAYASCTRLLGVQAAWATGDLLPGSGVTGGYTGGGHGCPLLDLHSPFGAGYLSSPARADASSVAEVFDFDMIASFYMSSRGVFLRESTHCSAPVECAKEFYTSCDSP